MHRIARQQHTPDMHAVHVYRNAANYSILQSIGHYYLIFRLRRVQMKRHNIAMSRCILMIRTHLWSPS